MVWFRGVGGMGDKSRKEVIIIFFCVAFHLFTQVLFLYKRVIAQWRWMHKAIIKKVAHNPYTLFSSSSPQFLSFSFSQSGHTNSILTRAPWKFSYS